MDSLRCRNTCILQKTFCLKTQSLILYLKGNSHAINDVLTIEDGKVYLVEQHMNSNDFVLLTFTSEIDNEVVFVVPSKFKGNSNGYSAVAKSRGFYIDVCKCMNVGMFLNFVNDLGVEDMKLFNPPQTMVANFNKVMDTMSVCEKEANLVIMQVTDMSQKIKDIEYAQQLYIDYVQSTGEKFVDFSQRLEQCEGSLKKEIDNNDALQERLRIQEEKSNLLLSRIEENKESIIELRDAISNIEKLLMRVVVDVNDLKLA